MPRTLGAAAGVLFATSTCSSTAATILVPSFQVAAPGTCTTPPRGYPRWSSFYVTGRYSSSCQLAAQPHRSLLSTTHRRSRTATVAAVGRLKLLCTSQQQQQQEHPPRFAGGEVDDSGGLLDPSGGTTDVGRGDVEEYTGRCAFCVSRV